MNKESQTESLYTFGPFRVDPVERVLLRDGEPVALQPKLFDTLLALVERSGHVVAKGELMETIWPDAFVEEGNLASNVSLLRKVLGENQNGKPYIETIARRGYRFSAEIRRVPHSGVNVVLRRRSRARLITTTEEITDEELEAAETQSLPEVGAAGKAVAILPFITLGVEPHEEYLGLGLADALITQLANTKQMIVRPTSAIKMYAGMSEDSASVGRQLRVGAVLEGSLQRAGERLRVTVRFINTRDGAVLWAEKFNFNFTDIFEVQDEIAERVVNSMMLNLSNEERARLMKRYTENAEAYSAYLKGRYFWNRRTVEGFRKAVDFFSRAIEIDPSYALAYSGLADVYNLLLIWGEASSPRETCLRGEAAALKALSIDPLLSEAHASLGYNMICQWRWREAEAALTRSIELNPNYASARSWYANYLKSVDRFDEAIAEVKVALRLDPLSPMIKTTFGANYMFAGQYVPAIEQLRQVLDFDPNFVPALTCLGMVYGWQGRHEEAIACARRVFELAEGHETAAGLLAARYAMAGRRDEALRLLTELEDAAKSNYGLTYSIASVYSCLNEKEQALAWLERAYADHNSLLNDLKVDKEFSNLYSDPRFQDLVRRIGLNP